MLIQKNRMLAGLDLLSLKPGKDLLNVFLLFVFRASFADALEEMNHDLFFFD